MNRSRPPGTAVHTVDARPAAEPVGLPRSFEDLGRRLGFADEALALRYGDRQKLRPEKKDDPTTGHEEFVRLFGNSVLFAAERDSSFYEQARIRASNEPLR